MSLFPINCVFVIIGKIYTVKQGGKNDHFLLYYYTSSHHHAGEGGRRERGRERGRVGERERGREEGGREGGGREGGRGTRALNRDNKYHCFTSLYFGVSAVTLKVGQYYQ